MNHSNSRFISFVETFRQHHSPKNALKQTEATFFKMEKFFLSVFQLGLFETYNYLYHHCQSTEDFKNWIIAIKGETFFRSAESQFNQWEASDSKHNPLLTADTLTHEQRTFWEEQGYLKIENLVSSHDCDAVSALICQTLGINLQDKNSWYPIHEKLQGLMLQLYQDKAIERIRNNNQIKQLFINLYRNQNILPNTEKVSYNPPVSENYTFKGSPLHWDIDFSIGPQFYIQGLLYLNDVPVDRGPFTVVPGFHHQIEDFLQQHKTAEMAMGNLRKSNLAQPIAGNKGDLIVWLESLPHAASPNHSDLPRFVQYISFNPG